MNGLLSSLATLLRDPVPYHGALGWIAIITLERLNAVVGLLVGLATLLYLCLRIRDQLRDRKPRSTSEE
jgi:predicted transcriptional regulator